MRNPLRKWSVTVGQKAETTPQTFSSAHAILNGNITVLDITITMPSYNETAAIATVVADLQKSLLTATIYVYNNNSGNDTVSRTLAASASKPGACAFWRHPMLSILACNNVDNG